jgi:hypothetical protein
MTCIKKKKYGETIPKVTIAEFLILDRIPKIGKRIWAVLIALSQDFNRFAIYSKAIGDSLNPWLGAVMLTIL